MDDNKMDDNKIKDCEKCIKSFKSHTHYLLHCETEIHKTGKRKVRSNKKVDLICNICNLYTTRQTTNMKIHILNNHSDVETKKKGFKFYCVSCDYGIETEKQFNTHISTIKHKIKIIPKI